MANNPTDVFTIEEIAEAVAPVPSYKVYTAIISQTGESDTLSQTSGSVQEGVSYIISTPFGEEPSYDFSNVGGPIPPENFPFVATYNATPNEYGNAILNYDSGAPVVVTVLENTIGNVFFEFKGTGDYRFNSENLFNDGRTIGFITFNNSGTYSLVDKPALTINQDSTSALFINTALDGSYSNDVLYNAPIEIRVYPDPEAQ